METYYLKNTLNGIVDKNTDTLSEEIITKAVLKNETVIEALIEVVEESNEEN